MFNRQGSSHGDTRVQRSPESAQSLLNVAIFVDYASLQQAFEESAGGNAEPAALAQRLLSFGRAEGRVVFARAYADWTRRGPAARELNQNRFEPILTLGSGVDTGTAAVTLSLDAIGCLRQKPRIDVVLLASGDNSLLPLCRKLRGLGVEVILACPRGGIERELTEAGDRVRWLDDLFQTWPDEDEPLDMQEYEWGPFVRLLNDLEENLEFVGLNYLIRKVLDRGNCGYSDLRRKQEIINAAQELGIIEVYQVENKDHRGDPVSACRLVLENELVEDLLAEQVT